jgi:hypothetical protein
VSNTVLLAGKGMIVNIIFSVLVKHYPDAVWTQPKLKWWQQQTRHELRLHNLSNNEIVELRRRFAVEGSVPVTVEVF